MYNTPHLTKYEIVSLAIDAILDDPSESSSELANLSRRVLLKKIAHMHGEKRSNPNKDTSPAGVQSKERYTQDKTTLPPTHLLSKHHREKPKPHQNFTVSAQPNVYQIISHTLWVCNRLLIDLYTPKLRVTLHQRQPIERAETVENLKTKQNHTSQNHVTHIQSRQNE